MTSSTGETSDPLKGLTEKQIADLVKANESLDIEESKLIREKEDEKVLQELSIKKNPYRRLKKSPLEIINRLLFFIFIGSFLFSFVSVYSINTWWFSLYLISAFSCILYTPNRKALKELIAAWPNIQDLLRNRIVRKK